MALKDLIAQKASLAEDAIEEIISDFVRFDPDEKAVAFTPAAGALPNRSKVLIYLVALQGWSFVSEETIPTDAKPAEIEEHTGIQGGSLRPILKEMKDRHLITERSGRYSVRAASLPAIKVELGGNEVGTTKKPKTRRAGKKARKTESTDAPAATNEEQETKVGSSSKKKAAGNIAERFDKWIDDGFFNEAKTLSDVQKRFHKEAILVPRTSIPKYLLKAVRDGRLGREKGQSNGKTVWVYKRED